MFLYFTTAPEDPESSSTKTRVRRVPEVARHTCLIPEHGLPPVVQSTGGTCTYKFVTSALAIGNIYMHL